MTAKELFEKIKSVVKDDPNAAVFLNDEPLETFEYSPQGEDDGLVLLWDRKYGSIHDVLKAKPKMGAKKVISTLAGQGINVSESMVYYVKGWMRGQRLAQKSLAITVTTRMKTQ
jgi:hypothetical protein